MALLLELLPDKAEFSGTYPDFTVILRNTGAAELKLSAYMLDYRLKSAMTAGRLENQPFAVELQPFKPATWARPGPTDLVTLMPQQELKIRLELSKERVFAFVRRDVSTPQIMATEIVAPLPAGLWLFRTNVWDQVALYVGKEGRFDYQLECKRLREIHHSEDLFHELTEGQCEVRLS